MNNSCLLTLLLWFVPGSILATGLSAETNGVYVAVEGWRPGAGIITNEPIRASDDLVFLVYCRTGWAELAYPLDSGYFANISMLGPDGREVARTALGKTFGAKFDQLRSYEDTKMGLIFGWGTFEGSAGLGQMKPLPSPERLFKIRRPGIYILRIQMQMFYVDKKPGAWSRILTRFSRVEVKVQRFDK